MENKELNQHLEALEKWSKDISYYDTCVNQKVIVKLIRMITPILQNLNERLSELEESKENDRNINHERK